MAIPAVVTFQPTLSTYSEDASTPTDGGATNVKKVYDVEFVNVDDTKATIQHDFGKQAQFSAPKEFHPIVIVDVIAMGTVAAAAVLDFVMDGTGNQLGVSKNTAVANSTATFRITILYPQSVLAAPGYLVNIS